MSRVEAVSQYQYALKLGQKYYKNAEARGIEPFLPALSELADLSEVSREELGLVNVPSGLIVGTTDSGRKTALAGNFMPLLPEGSEFSAKWVSLCEAHLGDEGIRDPIRCCEYMGRFYVQEGNKRASVLKSYDAPTVPAMVTRLVPPLSDDHEIQVYYEFMHFYSLTGIYGLDFSHRKQYRQLIESLGYETEHVWTDDERRSFRAGFVHFEAAFEAARPEGSTVTSAEGLLYWLSIYSFAQTKEMLRKEITKILVSNWHKLEAEFAPSITINTDPVEKNPNLVTKLLKLGASSTHVAAFIYGLDPAESEWTRSHELGRQHLQEALGNKISTRVYMADSRDYMSAMERAVAEGADIIFATLPNMINEARRIAALEPDVKMHVCSLSRPHAGVRNYYTRIYESKFIAGAIAGAMADGNTIGYIADYPIMGVPAAINAFALGTRLTKPQARVMLRWSCTEGDPRREFAERGVNIVSNRDATGPVNAYSAMDWGLYKITAEGIVPLGTPCWNWGEVYEIIVNSVFSGAWKDGSLGEAVNYWWGMNAGVIDIHMANTLPAGLRTLAQILRRGIIDESIKPFFCEMRDNNGTLRSDGSRDLSPEEIMYMDWLMENVDGEIPLPDALIERAKETVALLGIYDREQPAEKEAQQ